MECRKSKQERKGIKGTGIRNSIEVFTKLLGKEMSEIDSF